ncbi:MAG TPA: hypothetical protein VFK28_03960, partial [Sphingomicrobium sp.]|nr:hypothetical protein [Sphingomicrobium sp.]
MGRFARGRVAARSGDRLDVGEQRPQFGRDAPAAPAAQVDRLELTEAERREGAVNGDRHQPGTVAPGCGLIADPGGFDRVRRPQNDDGIGSLERLFDDLGELRAAANMQVPPYLVAGLFQRTRKLARAIAVVTVIAQEHAGHEQPPSAHAARKGARRQVRQLARTRPRHKSVAAFRIDKD